MSFAYQRQFSSDSTNGIFSGEENDGIRTLCLRISHLKLSNRTKIGIGLSLAITLVLIIVAVALRQSPIGNAERIHQSTESTSTKPLASTQSPRLTTSPPRTSSTETPKLQNLSVVPNRLTNVDDLFENGGILLSLSSSNASSSKLLRLSFESKKVQVVSKPFKGLVSSMDFDWQHR